ncbi:hypothetical protein H4582DRAFT_1876692 [Lactarius indigo]|nr:hypothetical protein H4582DRAFT_1876692 [Lactarius indigo]
MADYDIFRHHLLITAPAYGYALWDPDPGDLYPAVEVGDVGYICEGKFHRLFNVLLPAKHPSHDNGVPEYHEPLEIKNHIFKGTLIPQNLCSTSVTPESDLQANGPKEEGEVSFLCQMNQGAVLCLPIKAKKEDTRAKNTFGRWMTKHIDTWFAWAHQLGLGVDRMEDIVLVTGTHRTRSFTNVAFPGGRKDARVSFRAKVDHPDDIVTINWQFSRENIQGAHLNPGPDGKDLPEDQCIFIRGFRVIRKYKIFPRLKGAAGPNPDPEGSDEEPDKELVSVPAVPEYQDPLHILLKFIAEEAPNCDMVLVHDDDLAELHGIYDDTPIESLQPDVMLSHLRSAELKIHEIPFGSDLLSADNGGSADTETVLVATLSNLFEELSPSSASPSSQSLLHVQAPLLRIERSLPHVGPVNRVLNEQASVSVTPSPPFDADARLRQFSDPPPYTSVDSAANPSPMKPAAGPPSQEHSIALPSKNPFDTVHEYDLMSRGRYYALVKVRSHAQNFGDPPLLHFGDELNGDIVLFRENLSDMRSLEVVVSWFPNY